MLMDGRSHHGFLPSVSFELRIVLQKGGEENEEIFSDGWHRHFVRGRGLVFRLDRFPA